VAGRHKNGTKQFPQLSKREKLSSRARTIRLVRDMDRVIARMHPEVKLKSF
jgi:hypothetical protein